MYRVKRLVKRLVKIVLNGVLRKCNGFKKVKMDQWNEKSWLELFVVWGLCF